jgi:hypothetical protein
VALECGKVDVITAQVAGQLAPARKVVHDSAHGGAAADGLVAQSAASCLLTPGILSFHPEKGTVTER